MTRASGIRQRHVVGLWKQLRSTFVLRFLDRRFIVEVLVRVLAGRLHKKGEVLLGCLLIVETNRITVHFLHMQAGLGALVSYDWYELRLATG